MKDKNGIEVEVGDRVFFSYYGTDPESGLTDSDSYGQVMEVSDTDVKIWVEGRSGCPLWNRNSDEVEIVSRQQANLTPPQKCSQCSNITPCDTVNFNGMTLPCCKKCHI